MINLSLSLLHMLMTALQQNWLHADTSLSLSFCPSIRVCLFLSPFVSIFVDLSVCLYMSVSLCVSLCLSLYLYVSLCRCVCVCVSECVSVCVSVSVSVSLLWYDFDTSLSRYAYLVGLIALTTERTFSRFYCFLMKIYVCNICGVGVTYKMVWSKYQNCIRYVSYVTYHTHTHIYIYKYIFSFTQHILLFLIHLC